MSLVISAFLGGLLGIIFVAFVFYAVARIVAYLDERGLRR